MDLYFDPTYWSEVERRGDGIALRWKLDKRMTLIVSVSTQEDGKRWLHLSIAHPLRQPPIDLLRKTKEMVAPGRYGYMAFPPPDRYVNIHPNALHVFVCLDVPEGKLLPEFSGTLPGVGRSI